MTDLKKLINNEEVRLKNSNSPNVKVGILFNVIILKNKYNRTSDNYVDIKSLINCYINLVKEGDYGYDSINYEKLKKTLNYLNYQQQISVCRYALSVISRELPEHDKEWFLKEINSAEVKKIWCEKDWINYPKAILLFSGETLFGLISTFVLMFIISYILLLPASFEFLEVFHISYENYAKNFYLNHFLNLISLFCSIDNELKITVLSGWGLIIMAFGKIIFAVIIVNFIYRKVSDKISIK